MLGVDRADLERLAGQPLIVGFVGTHSSSSGLSALTDQIDRGLVGGVILLERNIESISQTTALTEALQDAAGRQPLVVAIDEEGGAVTRTENKPGFSHWVAAREVAESLGSPEAAREYYRARADELRQAGVTINLAPVVDVDVNPASPAIGRLGRSFSSDPERVAAFAQAFVLGHHDAGVLTCAKHFPGHGSAWGDSHDGLVDVTRTWEEGELAPYGALVRSGTLEALMTSHLVHAAFTGNNHTPVSLSAQAVEWVRRSLRFQGPILTDDLQMAAVARTHSAEAAAVQALAAGNDLLVLSNYEAPDPDLGERVNAAIVQAVVDGELSEERLQAAAATGADLRG